MIFLAVYYLFRMSWIVDRIVNVDAPAATLAQQASIEMLEVRRTERNYLLLRDANYLEANRESIDKIQQILDHIRNLEPDEQDALQRASVALALYRERFGTAVFRVLRANRVGLCLLADFSLVVPADGHRDSPRRGMIRVHPQNLISLAQALHGQ